MANLNKVMLIGRLTRDPEVRTFSNGGKVTAFGFAVNNRKKNNQTGQWEDDPVFLDCEAFNRESGKQLADLINQYLKKGSQAFIEGYLKLDQWQDKNDGSKRSKVKVVVYDVQFLSPKEDGTQQDEGQQRGGRSQQERPPQRANLPPSRGQQYEDEDDYSSKNQDEIPF